MDFRHQLVPIAQPSCPTASLITGLFDTPHRLTASQPRVWGRCSPLAQVLFVAGAIGAGGAAMRPSPGGEAGAPRDATNPIRRRRSLRSPPAANTPRLLPQGEEFPPLQGDLWLPTFWELVTPSLANKPWSEAAAMFGGLLGRGPAGKRVPPSLSPPPSPPRLPRSLPGAQLPTAAGPAAPGRGRAPPAPQRRGRAASGTLPALSASQRLRKKGGRDPCLRGRLPPGSPSFSPRLQPFSQTQLGSWELSRSRSHPDPT